MQSTKSFILRKLSTTFVATTIFSFLLVLNFSIVDGFEFKYNRGNQLIGWFLFYSIYVGVIILFYGNLVSIIVEKLQTKWFPKHNWLYIFFLGVFGLANGLIFQAGSFALLGMVAAVIYGVIDKWIYKRTIENKGIKMFFLIPLASLLICWGFLQFTSPPEPPFTKDDAVHFATSGEGTVIEYFPDEIGKWEGNIEGYQVTRETNANEIGQEMYIVTFTEKWKKGNDSGVRTLSYQVERGSLTHHDEQGEVPPYY
jgi:hypothetical protein